MILVRLSVVAFMLFSVKIAQANIPGLAALYGRSIDLAKNAIASSGALAAVTPPYCELPIQNLADDGSINITVAFGYMDVTGGQEGGASNSSLYKNGNTLDRDAFSALETSLLTACNPYSSKGRTVKFTACGFKKNGNVLTKIIRDRFSGSRVRVNVKMMAPSETSINAVNSKSSRQQTLSQKTQNLFLNGIQNDDVVIYMGHARSGGGPDFFPPVLTASGRVDYDYYRSRREGIRAMLGALQSADQKPKVIGVLACKSTPLFSRSILTNAPGAILVSAGELFDYNDILPTGFAMIEAVVGQRCADQFKKIVRTQPSSRSFLDIFD